MFFDHNPDRSHLHAVGSIAVAHMAVVVVHSAVVVAAAAAAHTANIVDVAVDNAVDEVGGDGGGGGVGVAAPACGDPWT